MSPLCPRDGTPLSSTPDVLGPGTVALVCPKCAGVQVEWKVAQKFFEALGLTLADLQTSVAKAEAVASPTPPSQCTGCNKGPLKTFLLMGVQLDLCPECGASWFDRGELARVSKGKYGANLAEAPQPAAGERVEAVGVFEMFWDCAYCDTKALLGASNRCCPKCGAAQDATRRYFPPPGQEIAANVEFAGADSTCPACSTPNGAKATFCRQCGSPMDGSARVATVADRVERAPGPSAAAGGAARSGKTPLWLWAVGAAMAALCTFCGVVALWTKDAEVTVTGHRWAREIDVEAMAPRSDSSWCDSMPSDAYSVSRQRAQRSTKQIPDGEVCGTRDVDRGNGTFERRKECRPKFREEPVYDERCSFTVDRWSRVRTATADGRGLDSTPEWPRVSLGRTGSCRGCEREGTRRETYTVELEGPGGERWTCDVGQEKWRALSEGSARQVKVGVIGGGVHCDTL